MSGTELAAQASLQNPGLAVIFASGQAQDPEVPTNSEAIRLTKPYSGDALAEAIVSAARKCRA
jgi:hypothetical protein